MKKDHQNREGDIELRLKEAFSTIIRSHENHINSECLANTPKRAAEAFLFLTQGYQTDIKKVVNGAIYEAPNQEMVVVKDIEFYSLCEHHLLPMIGKCHIGYIPNKKIVGVSKIPRIVDLYARRLQLQENLTHQIAEAIDQIIESQGTIVVMEATHLCVLMRGVEKQHPQLKSIASTGLFQQDVEYQDRFYRLLNA